ncbi:MAG: LysM peptidoglycan-binding domain-containing protein [Desulfotalea sp.]
MPYSRYLLIFLLPQFLLFSACTNINNQELNTVNIGVETEEGRKELQDLEKAGSWNLESEDVIVEHCSNPKADPKKVFPLVITPQVQVYLDKFQGKSSKRMTRWFERSGKYVDMMEKELSEKGLPNELVYLAMIESAFVQNAKSHASAVGLWQFMKRTGQGYDLRVDRFVDERRNALKSTKAAATYLSDLYDRFGDWYLAVAAYNAGPGKVNHGLTKYKVDNFWDLAETNHLRLETKSYVPKLIATIILSKNLNKYGFDPVQLADPVEFDVISVGPSLPLGAVAKISGGTKNEIKELNMELRQNRTPANVKSYDVHIPKGSYDLAAENLSRLHSVASTGMKIHIYKKGEKISRICRKYNINSSTLFKVNGIKNSKIAHNKRLKIPYSTISYRLLPKGDKKAMMEYKNSLVLHKIKKGESISTIARKYSLPASAIVSWNGLKDAAKIRAGQQLALYINHVGGKVSASKRTGQVILADDKKIKSDNEEVSEFVRIKADGKKRVKHNNDDFVWYLVKNGDSLWTISRKFRVSPNVIKKINNLDSNLIKPGNKLKIVKG